MLHPLATEQTDSQQDNTHADDAAVAFLAMFLRSPAATTSTALPEHLVTMLTGLGLQRDAVLSAARLVLTEPTTHPAGYRTAMVRTVTAQEPELRARYLLSAAKRLTAGSLNGVFPQALRVEQTYADQQRAAARNRVRAATAYDTATAKAGPNGKLQWHTAEDDRVTPDCAALNGRIFDPGDPPNGELAGAVHARCRCFVTAATDTFSPLPLLFATP